MWHSVGTCNPVSGLKNQGTQKAHAQLLTNEQRAHALFSVGIESAHPMLLKPNRKDLTLRINLVTEYGFCTYDLGVLDTHRG